MHSVLEGKNEAVKVDMRDGCEGWDVKSKSEGRQISSV
jgi:hypothetical protein